MTRRTRRLLVLGASGLFAGALLAVGLGVAGARGGDAARALDKLPPGLAAHRDIAYRSDTPAPHNLLDIVTHEDPAGGARPAIVFIHGGGWIGGDKSWERPAMARYAELGYVTVSANYRLANVAPFPAPLDDVKAAVRWLREHASEHGVDPDRIGLYGYSAGAHLAALAVLDEDPAPVRCAVLRSGIYDLRPETLGWGGSHHRAVVGLLGGPADRDPDLAAEASPIGHLDRGGPSLLLIHGTEDELVPFETAARMADALAGSSVPFESYWVQGGRHGGGSDRPALAEAADRQERFFKGHLCP